MRKAIVLALVALFALAGCVTSTDADVASKNLATAAEQFQINRRVVFFNGITDKYLLSIEGRCSVDNLGNQLQVICKVAPDAYKKHMLGLSQNVSYFVEQLAPVDVSVYQYKVIFKPEAIIPDIELK